MLLLFKSCNGIHYNTFEKMSDPYIGTKLNYLTKIDKK